jgi:hypothetical protein
VRQVDLVDDRNDREVLLHRQMNVGDGLGLDSLGGVHNQDCAFAGAQASRYLVGKVHVAWGVDQVEFVLLPILGRVIHRDRMGLDRDASLLFEIHRIQHLVMHVPLGNGACALQQPVGKRGLPMVDVGDDRKIPDMSCVH